jgi:hypothetical protein
MIGMLGRSRTNPFAVGLIAGIWIVSAAALDCDGDPLRHRGGVGGHVGGGAGGAGGQAGSGLGGHTGAGGATTAASGGGAGGVDAGAACAGPPPFTCVAGALAPSGGVACGDLASAPTCDSGQWSCPPGQVRTSDCACSSPHAGPCTLCTPSGWSCGAPGTGGSSGAGGATGGAVDAASVCYPSCAQFDPGNVCPGTSITWVCGVPEEGAVLVDAGCTELPNIYTLCCPAGFKLACRY